MKLKFFLLNIICCLAVTFYFISNASADEKSAALVIDANSGRILFQENADKIRYPASLTKMMTVYLAFEALDNGKLTMEKQIPISDFAIRQKPIKMGFKKNSTIDVRSVILSVIVRSANDAAVVLAESLGGSEENFAKMMTRKARFLGMKNTVFRNASGLHDPGQYTTSVDLAILAVALRRDFPHYYYLFKTDKFAYKNRTITTHNLVNKTFRGADGLKTGFVNASGYNLVTSAKRDGYSLVGVVLGGRTANDRNKRMVNLLEKSFTKLASDKFGSTNIKEAKNQYGDKSNTIYGKKITENNKNIAEQSPIINANITQDELDVNDNITEAIAKTEITQSPLPKLKPFSQYEVTKKNVTNPKNVNVKKKDIKKKPIKKPSQKKNINRKKTPPKKNKNLSAGIVGSSSGT